MSNLVLSLVVKLITSLGSAGLREYAVEFVSWLRVKAKESDNPIDDAVVDVLAVFLGVE